MFFNHDLVYINTFAVCITKILAYPIWNYFPLIFRNHLFSFAKYFSPAYFLPFFILNLFI